MAIAGLKRDAAFHSHTTYRISVTAWLLKALPDRHVFP
jgi:hypothetical protein